jgi:hypothetical protein
LGKSGPGAAPERVRKGLRISGGSFTEGCPECGRRMEVPDVEFARNAKYLHEDKFLE